MDVELQINNSTAADARFLSWSASPCRIRVSNPAGVNTPTVSVKISGASSANGGAVVFRAATTGAFSSSVTVTIPVDGTTVPFFAAGKQPSVKDGDVKIEARVGTTLVGSVPVMVRIRKDANGLTPAERDRFVSAFAKLNNQGLGRFTDFREMHKTPPSLAQAHGTPAFLPWHRAYLLDLERGLQGIDPSVTLPYWRFDKPAPNIFTPDFFGSSDSLGTVKFSATNPLQFWKTDGVQGVNRRPLFKTSVAPPNLSNETETLGLGNTFKAFSDMEGDPHGLAHTSFGGSIQDPATAPKDPLFFLLHCNVDRLWAKWQRVNNRFDPAVAASYVKNPTDPFGHKLGDTMWPWDDIKNTGGRPPIAPGGPMAPSPCVDAPGGKPRVRDCLDYHGIINAASTMAFDYDDVPL